MKLSNLLMISILAIISIIVFSNKLNNEFVWDDPVFIKDNLEIRSLKNIPSFFSEDVLGIYRPLRTTLYAITYSVSGLNPLGYHLIGLAMHISVVILIFLIIKNIFKSSILAFLTALFFSIHPLHTERVTNITGSFDLLGIMFMLLSFYTFLTSYQKEGKALKKYASSILFFILALLSTEEAIILPILILVYLIFFSNENSDAKDEENKSKFAKKDYMKSGALYFIPLLIYIALRFFILNIGARAEQYAAGSFITTMAMMPEIILKYIYLLLWPVNLTVSYLNKAPETIFGWQIIVSIIIILAIIFLAIKLKNKVIKFSIAWFFITLLPFMSILPVRILMAERYTYLASLGFCLLLAYTITSLARIKNGKTIAAIAAIAILLFYTTATIARNNDWQDSISLWQEAVKVTPESSTAHDNLAFALEEKEMYDEALQEYLMAITLDKTSIRPRSNLGVLLAKAGDYEKAEIVLKEALPLAPNDYKILNNLGQVYNAMKNYTEAIPYLKKSIEINPGYDLSHNNLGISYGSLGKIGLAVEEFETALRLNPANADAKRNLDAVKALP